MSGKDARLQRSKNFRQKILEIQSPIYQTSLWGFQRVLPLVVQGKVGVWGRKNYASKKYGFPPPKIKLHPMPVLHLLECRRCFPSLY